MIDIISLTGAAVASASSLVELAKNIKNAELQNQIGELRVQLATIQNETASLIKENRTLITELDYLKDDKANPLVFNPKDGFYYDSESSVPYCPNCYEGEKRERRHLKVKFKECPNCHEVYEEAAPSISLTHRSG